MRENKVEKDILDYVLVVFFFYFLSYYHYHFINIP